MSEETLKSPSYKDMSAIFIGKRVDKKENLSAFLFPGC